jgi:hypothetical protein
MREGKWSSQASVVVAVVQYEWDWMRRRESRRIRIQDGIELGGELEPEGAHTKRAKA